MERFGSSVLSELEALDAETFEVVDYTNETDNQMLETCSTSSCSSSCCSTVISTSSG